MAPTLVQHPGGQRVGEGGTREGHPAPQAVTQDIGFHRVPRVVTHRAPRPTVKHLNAPGTVVHATGEPPFLVFWGEKGRIWGHPTDA